MSPYNFIDPSVKLGSNTKVWHFAVILANVEIGNDCSIGSHAEIGRGSVIGSNTRISHGVFLPPNSIISHDVFIGPGVVFTDDKYPLAGNKDYDANPPSIDHGASIGAGAVILPGIHIGAHALIGAGAVVTHDVHPGQHVRGEPAREKALFQPLVHT